MQSPLRIDLEPRLDSEDNIYHIGAQNFPGTIDLSRTTFLIFTSQEGAEEMQVTIDDKEHSSTSFVQKQVDRIKVKLGTRTDQKGAKYYVGKVRLGGYVKANKVDFIIFTSKEGEETLQIRGDFVWDDQPAPTLERERPRRQRRTPVDEVEVETLRKY